LSATGGDGASGDADLDGLCNYDEFQLGCDPNIVDSDGDGVSDYQEICNGSNPSDGTDHGVPSANFPNRGMLFNVHGDYAAWRMTIAGRGPIDYQSDTVSMTSPGAGNEKMKILKKGNSYRLTMNWLNSNGHTNPNWYCWQAKINGLPATASYQSYTSTRLSGNEIVYGLGWMAENADGLLTDHVHTYDGAGGNVAEGLEALLHVYKCEITICDSDDESWTEIEKSRVLLDNEDLKIKIKISPAIQTFDLCKLIMGSNVVVKTSGTCPSGAAIPIASSEFENFSGYSEIKLTRTRAQLIALGLLPSQDDDGVDEMAWLDMASGSGQSLADSEAFAGLGYADRGTSCSDASKTLTSTPPNSIPSESYFKAAGREIVVVAYGGVASDARQLMNQADIFYFSGHGDHATGAIQGGFTPSMASSYWNRDLDCAIIAGCAVLDVRNYRLNTQKFLYRLRHYNLHGTYPGEQWENCGAKHLLGYALKAPLDSRGGTVIAERFVEQMKAGRSVCESWRIANDCSEGRNACIIDCSASPHEFWFWDESLGHAVWTNKVKGISGWIEN